MNKDHQQVKSEDTPDAREVSPADQVTLVIEDVRALVKAELEYLRSRIDYSRHVMKWSLLFGGIAALAFSGAAIALVVGLVLTLAPRIGPGWATLVVTVSFVIIGSVCAMQGRNWVRKVYFPEIDKNDDNIA